MLKLPAWRTFNEHRVTAYQDDTMFWKFYLIPNYVTIRTDEDGKPIFLLVAFAFGDQDREEKPDLPRGGGYMVLDVEMRVEPAAEKAITTALQKDVDQLWNQLKALADAARKDVRGYRITSRHNLPNLSTNVSLGVDDVLLGLGPEGPTAPPGNAPPKVILSDPTWTSGTFRVSAPQSQLLVTNRLAEGAVSLVGTNVASANLDLTSMGADFMVQTLVDPDNTGATDLTPIQVTYNMKFAARVPPVKVHASANTREVYTAVKGIFHNYEGGGCDEDTMSHSEQNMQMAISSGLIDIKVDVGFPGTPDDLVTQMRQDAVKAIQDALAARLASKKQPAAPPADDPTKDFVNKESDIYFLKTESSVDFSTFVYDEELSTVRESAINPQGTLQGFLKGLSASEVKQYVRKITLDDPFFQTLNLKAYVFGIDWDKDPVDAVQVEFKYDGVDENNRPDSKSTAANFTKDVKEFKWDPSLIGAKREYSYRWRVIYKGGTTSAWTQFERSSTNRLSIAVRAPGKIEIKLRAGNIDFANITKTVQVELEYEDSSQGVTKETSAFILDGSAAEQVYTRWIFVPRTKPVRYRARFFLKNDQTVETRWAETTSNQLLINEPRSENRLDVQILPTGRWKRVVQSVVNINYADPRNSVSAEGVFRLKAVDEFKTWSAYLADGAPRKFQYMITTSYDDGSLDKTSWISAEGDQPLVIGAKEPAELNVDVLPMLLDFKTTPIVEVGLAYEDPANGINESETFAFTSPEKQSWVLPIRNPGKKDFKVRITYNGNDGRVVEVPEFVSPDEKVTVQKLLVPEVACLMVPKLVDFVATPVVEVNIHYADPPRGVDTTETFTFTEPKEQQFRLRTDAAGPKTFDVEVTYYLTNGQVVTRAPVPMNRSQIVVPKYVATA
ncbi:hypothetical protein G3545_21985 [Starkeya sp. ORNL1]|uniref:hypothetical protein n=1 Tax=Starkeya sp. ORNL1 TaxID=2709380 RepID=UPI001462E981|nr:hypothetical protein [Starkeya sp. ORNL1]QJP16076.1 hypothetical protein G3545_21985 [Starkeya sp. ORNL1]